MTFGHPFFVFTSFRHLYTRLRHTENPHESLILAGFAFSFFASNGPRNPTLMLKSSIVFPSATFCLQPFRLVHHHFSVNGNFIYLFFCFAYQLLTVFL